MPFLLDGRDKNMPKKEKYKMLAEDDEGNWIQVHFDEDGDPEWYDIFFMENTICISTSPEAFNRIKELFRKSIAKRPSQEEIV